MLEKLNAVAWYEAPTGLQHTDRSIEPEILYDFAGALHSARGLPDEPA